LLSAVFKCKPGQCLSNSNPHLFGFREAEIP
jgi:hypothetical protein